MELHYRQEHLQGRLVELGSDSLTIKVAFPSSASRSPILAERMSRAHKARITHDWRGVTKGR